jgi:hypothetical protein
MITRANSTLLLLGASWFLTACGPDGVCQGIGYCPDCGGPEVTCTFGGLQVTEPSCDGCQARRSLYEALCDAGSEVSLEEVTASMVCDDEDSDSAP